MRGYRFGRKAHDPARVSTAPMHRFGTLRPPVVLDRSAIAFMPELYGNNIYPDCTAVAMANGARAVAALNGFDLIINPAFVPMFYAESIGYNGPDLASTEGAVMLDVLKYQAQNGFHIGPQMLAGRWGTVDATNRFALANSINRFGFGWWGVVLKERDMDNAGLNTWDVVPGRDDGAIEGRHCVVAWDYTGLADSNTVRIGTWGGWQFVTWGWVRVRLEEAYGLTPDELVAALP
jgi:hypothetical protein